MTHTPGPWIVALTEDPQEIEISAPNGERCLGYVRWEGLAIVYGCDDHPRTGKRIARANADLIAAAPDLLVALEKAVALYGKAGGPWNVPREPGTWIEMAENAIAKAKGVSK